VSTRPIATADHGATEWSMSGNLGDVYKSSHSSTEVWSHFSTRPPTSRYVITHYENYQAFTQILW